MEQVITVYDKATVLKNTLSLADLMLKGHSLGRSKGWKKEILLKNW